MNHLLHIIIKSVSCYHSVTSYHSVLYQVKEDRDEEEEEDRSNTDNSAPRKKKKDKAPLKEVTSKAPKLKISSNSLLKDERISNAFKFEDAELKGTSLKTDRPPQPSGKRRKTDDKIKIEIEPDRKFNKHKLGFKKSTRYLGLKLSKTFLFRIYQIIATQ